MTTREVTVVITYDDKRVDWQYIESEIYLIDRSVTVTVTAPAVEGDA